MDASPERVEIQGKVVASKEELYVANSLSKFGWTYDYQVPFFGGWAISGGFVMDFVVHTAPLLTPLSVKGEYWHRGLQTEKDRLNELLLQAKLKGYAPTISLFGAELADQDESDKAILHTFGRR